MNRCSFIGAGLCLSKIPFIAPLGTFLIFFANGGIYATTTRHIDNTIMKEFNLIALSLWLFIGDFGSVIGANVLPYIDDFVCKHHSQYICNSSS